MGASGKKMAHILLNPVSRKQIQMKIIYGKKILPTLPIGSIGFGEKFMINFFPKENLVLPWFDTQRS